MSAAMFKWLAVLVWEPHRVVPQYAVPVEDVIAQLVPGRPGDGVTSGGPVMPGADGLMVLTPSAGFGVHSSGGDVFTVRTVKRERPGAAFQPHDPDLAGYVVLDFDAFDEWLEEDEPILPAGAVLPAGRRRAHRAAVS